MKKARSCRAVALRKFPGCFLLKTNKSRSGAPSLWSAAGLESHRLGLLDKRVNVGHGTVVLSSDTMIPKSDTRRGADQGSAEDPLCFEATTQLDMEEGLLRMSRIAN